MTSVREKRGLRGFDGLLVAIVLQAGADYRKVVRLGYVANGHLTEAGRLLNTYNRPSDDEGLLKASQVADLLRVMQSRDFHTLLHIASKGHIATDDATDLLERLAA